MRLAVSQPRRRLQQGSYRKTEKHPDLLPLQPFHCFTLQPFKRIAVLIFKPLLVGRPGVTDEHRLRVTPSHIRFGVICREPVRTLWRITSTTSPFPGMSYFTSYVRSSFRGVDASRISAEELKNTAEGELSAISPISSGNTTP